MHEVVDDVRAFEHAGDGVGVRRVGPHPGDACLLRLLAAGDGGYVVVLGELGHEWSADRPGCSEDDDLHARAWEIRRLKYRRLMATWARLWIWS